MLRAASGLYVSIRHFAKEASNIEYLVKKGRIVVFMKGTPTDPSCGFSSAVVQILKLCNAKYEYVNVLDDEKVRQDIKTFSNWPTIPQVYIDGKFIGGCDILLEMHNNGELLEMLKSANLVPESMKVETKDTSTNRTQKAKNEKKSTE